MEILRTIVFYTKDRSMPFLIIGGHAVNHYGISRQTGDLDLLVPLTDKSKWQQLLSDLHYQEFQSTASFSRFKFQEIAAWPIDLMYVDGNTFQKMLRSSNFADFGLVSVPVISIEHLILLKINALKVFQEHRYSKDYSDLVSLLKKHRIPATELMNYCEKYATLELYERLTKDLSYTEKK